MQLQWMRDSTGALHILDRQSRQQNSNHHWFCRLSRSDSVQFGMPDSSIPDFAGFLWRWCQLEYVVFALLHDLHAQQITSAKLMAIKQLQLAGSFKKTIYSHRSFVRLFKL